ncbi:MFS transporter [Stenotrophomonas mori]|uniref:MFS transporter n=1 Tax=Stenotrophomonas mori TaxID=2871096 RepID=A0ABT0SD73_9GAMM|nr:MFS transporter [Stenotrophomonas mori]MCL7713273.1 MFS transporter [Stenotrophomonas mori]
MNAPRPRLWTPGFVLACLANFLMGMSFYVLMPTLPFHLLEQLRVGEATVGVILSSYVIAALLVRPFSGFVVDRFNAKHVYLVALAAYVLFTSGYLLAHTVLAYVLVRWGIGLTFAMMGTAANTQAIDIVPSPRRGEGIGFFGLMSSLAMALGPMAGLWLMDRYPFPVIFKAALGAGMAGLLVATLVRSPRKPRAGAATVLSLDRFLLLPGIPLALNLAVIGLGYGMLLAFAAIHGKQLGAANTGIFFTLMALGMMVSRAFSGRLIDGGRVVAATHGGSAAIVAGLGLMAAAGTPGTYYLAGLLAGFGFGVVYPAYQTMMVGLGSHAQRGTAVATYFCALDVGVGAGMLLAGAVAARFGLAAAFAGGAGLALGAGLFFALWLAPRRGRSPAG